MKNAQEAVERVVRNPKEEMPPGFAKIAANDDCSNGFAFDKALETLVVTGGRPRLNRGSLVVQRYQAAAKISQLHCAREDCGRHTRHYEVSDGRIFCNDFIVIVYFTDVCSDDGGYSGSSWLAQGPV